MENKSDREALQSETFPGAAISASVFGISVSTGLSTGQPTKTKGTRKLGNPCPILGNSNDEL